MLRPPGFRVRFESTEAIPSTVMVTVACWPACNVPELGEASTLPIRLDGSEIDQDTGPFWAVMVSVLPDRALSSTVVGDADSVPAVTAGDEVDGAGVGDGFGVGGDDDEGVDGGTEAGAVDDPVDDADDGVVGRPEAGDVPEPDTPVGMVTGTPGPLG
jgi:hypothetical protein